jgi:hypothetical protein
VDLELDISSHSPHALKSPRTKDTIVQEAHERLRREIEALRGALSSAHHQLETVTTSLHQKLARTYLSGKSHTLKFIRSSFIVKDQELANSVACQVGIYLPGLDPDPF